jgi:glycosyltransferase involved in cell wall biosynthesis
MKTVLILSFSNLATDPRVNRQIRFLHESYQVVAAGLADPALPGVTFVPLNYQPPIKNPMQRLTSAMRLLTRRYEAHYWQLPRTITALERLAGVQADVVIANDLEMLPVGVRLAAGAPVIFDAHEYAPRQFDNSLGWRIFLQGYRTYLCRAYIPRVAAMMTVSQGIADQYERDTGVCPIVVTNAPEYQPLEPRLQTDMAAPIRMIHHGAASPPRRIEIMLEAMRLLDDRFRLDLLLVPGSTAYIEQLKQMAADDPRVRFLPSVPMQELVRVSSAYDVGVFVAPPTTFNLRHTLPNKFFEFIQARLAVAIGPTPEMAGIVRQYDCGVVSADFTARGLAAALAPLDHEKLNHYKRQSHSIARLMSAEHNKATLLALVGNALAEKREYERRP